MKTDILSELLVSCGVRLAAIYFSNSENVAEQSFIWCEIQKDNIVDHFNNFNFVMLMRFLSIPWFYLVDEL